MTEFDNTATIQVSIFVLLMTASFSFLAVAVIRRVKHEIELRQRFSAKNSLPGLMALSIIAAAFQISPAQAQDQQLASADLNATYEQMFVSNATDTGLMEDDTTAPFLFLGGLDLNSDPADVSGVEQARLETCYSTARAAERSGGYHSDSDSDGAPMLSNLNKSVDAFYAKQRQRSQFDDCARQ